MDPRKFNVVTSMQELGKQIGNAMSTNVMERLFVRLLPSSGLVPEGVLRDRWESGEAWKELVHPRSKDFKNVALKRKFLHLEPASCAGV